MSFNPVELIIKKNGGIQIKEISFMISNYIDGNVTEYQMSALLMSIFFKDMEMSEIID